MIYLLGVIGLVIIAILGWLSVSEPKKQDNSGCSHRHTDTVFDGNRTKITCRICKNTLDHFTLK